MTTTQPVPTVGELMTGDPVVVAADLPLVEAARIMDAHHVSGLPVIEPDGRLAGAISQVDLVHAMTTAALWESWPGLLVRHLMSSPAITIRASERADDAARLMEDRLIHRLVVTTRDGETPIGVLSATDLVRAMAELDR